MICKENKPEYYDFINNQLNTNYTSELCRCIVSLDSLNHIKAIVVFHTFVFSERRCDISVSSDMSSYWLSRNLIVSTLDFAFNELDMNRIQSYVPINLDGWARSLTKLGATYEVYLEDWFGENKSAWLFSLLKKNVAASIVGKILNKRIR
jgi:hypothetical protein